MTIKTTRPRTPKGAPTVLAAPDLPIVDTAVANGALQSSLLAAPDGASGEANSGSATLDALSSSAPLSAPFPSPARITKATLLGSMLRAPGGASLASLMAATGWQAHTVRAALSGMRKTGTALAREKVDVDTIYRILGASADDALAVGGHGVTPLNEPIAVLSDNKARA
jgi:Protein of unknown function (DUF3489)/PaaX-like protein